jgi:hypothetical protein
MAHGARHRNPLRWTRALAICVLAAAAVWPATPVRAAATALGAGSLVNATLEPSQIALGEAAELTIIRSGTTMDPLSLPTVPGLEFRVVGQSHRIEIVNGATLVTTALIVRVTPSAAGVFTIPSVTPDSPPLVLRVSPDNGPSALRRFGALGAGGTRTDGIRLTADGSAFVRLVLPKREVYVGESMPVEIEIGMRNGFVSSLNGLPTLNGADFTLNNLSHQPERVQKIIDGKAFTLLTWHSVLAGVKPGKFALAVESPLTVRVRTRPQRESLLEDSLGDPFMQNFFGATVPKDITVSSPADDVTVLPLPADGRPADFSGAVGSFKIASELSTDTAAAGDPLTLRMHVTGAGNFDRVDSPMLDRLDAWKTYPPKSSFKSLDPVGYKGEKNFEQPLIAARPGEQTLPPVTFSYFDPSTRRYESVRSTPLRVTITPSAADRSLSAPTAVGAVTQTGSPPTPAPTAGPGTGLRPDHVAGRDAPAAGDEWTEHPSLVPLYLEPRFLALPSLLSFAVAGGWLRRRARAPAGRPRVRTRASKATRRALRELEAAAGAGDPARFFSLARSALAAPVGASLAAESVDVRRIFALADEAQYSGEPPSVTDYARWLEVVRTRLVARPP